MTPQRRTGIALILASVLLLLFMDVVGGNQFFFDYPLIFLLACVIFLAGVVMVVVGRARQGL